MLGIYSKLLGERKKENINPHYNTKNLSFISQTLNTSNTGSLIGSRSIVTTTTASVIEPKKTLGSCSSFGYFSSSVRNGVQAVRKETAMLLKQSKLSELE